MFRTILASGAGTGGAYMAADTNPAMNRYMMRVIEDTPLDPAALQYVGDGVNPLWAFATVVTMTMGGKVAASVGDYLRGVDARKTRRLEAELGGLYENEGKNDD